MTSLVGTVEGVQDASYVCQKCGGTLVALSIVHHKGDLRTKCVRCGHARVFYAVKPR